MHLFKTLTCGLQSSQACRGFGMSSAQHDDRFTTKMRQPTSDIEDAYAICTVCSVLQQVYLSVSIL